MASFCTPNEFAVAAQALNQTFSGAAQLTVGARIELGVEMVRHALNDLSTEAQRTEVLSVLGHRVMAAMQSGGLMAPAGHTALAESVIRAALN